jgi:beta-glucanase (GH16 family)
MMINFKIKTIFFTGSISFLMLLPGLCRGQQTLFHLYTKGAIDRYELAFNEEFDNGLNRDKWLTSFPWGRHLTGATEMQETQDYITDGNNLRFGDGIGYFEARKERTCGVCQPWRDSVAILENGKMNYRCFDYSTALLYSKNDYDFGWYEISFRQSPNSNGTWPAFWLFGASNEIDIFENKGERNGETHWDVHCKDGCEGSKGGWSKIDADLFKSFNVISLQWHREGMRWYFNGRNYKATRQPFTNRMNIIVNQAVSRTNDSKGFWVGPDATSIFPAYLAVDYIRYYKNIYTGSRYPAGKGISEVLQELMKQEENNSRTKVTASPKSKRKLLVSILYSGDKKTIAVNSQSKQSSTIYIYDSSGKQLVRKSIGALQKEEIANLPDESLFIILKQGKYILADRLDARR